MKGLKRLVIIMLSIALCINSFAVREVPAQDLKDAENLKSIFKREIEDLRVKDKREGRREAVARQEGRWVTFRDPVDNKDFQIFIRSDEEENLKKGVKKVFSPFNGRLLSPTMDMLEGKPSRQEIPLTIISPFSGNTFQAKLDPDELMKGKTLIDPYTGKRFRFMMELLDAEGRGEFLEKSWMVVTDAAFNEFRVRRGDVKDNKTVISPYDGTVTDVTFAGEDFLEEKSALKAEKKQSKIERMFRENLPVGVSKDLKQFGYDAFEVPITKIREEALSDMQQGMMGEPFSQMGRNLRDVVMGAGDGLREKSVFERELFAPPVNIPVSDDYIIGPDDNILVTIWGNVQERFPLQVDREGKIFLPKTGPVYVWGKKFKEVRELIVEKLQKHYANIDIHVSMGKLRSIAVFVVGEVKRPGRYSISSLSTALHALYAAGGPTKTGTLRSVKVIRTNESEKIIDLYQLLLKGDRSQDVVLESNDAIFISPIGKVMGIAGDVKRPAIYEGKGSITLEELLAMAGGFTAMSYLKRIQIERVQDHARKIVLDYKIDDVKALKDLCKNEIMRDGDLVLIYPISPIKRNYVTIRGNVERPGDYQFRNDMTIREILEEAGGVLPGTYLERAEIFRYRDDKTREIIAFDISRALSDKKTPDIILKEWDEIKVYNRAEVLTPQFVTIEGTVNKPGRYELLEGMRLSDLVFRAGDVKETASLNNAELYRTGESNRPLVIPVDLKKVIEKDRDADILLSNSDHLFVRESSRWVEKRVVTIAGEIKFPGDYVAGAGETLSSVIERAGGFTEKAFLKGAVFTRKSLREKQEAMLRKYIEIAQQSVLQEQSQWATGVSTAQIDARKELLDFRERTLKAMEDTQLLGRMVINLDDLEYFIGSPYDIVVEDGDKLYIPTVPSSVQIIGTVYNPTAVTYVANRGLDYYIRKVGGITKTADVKRIYVIRSNGEAEGNFARTKTIQRGDTIVVPEEFKYKTPTGILLKDSLSVLSQAALFALAIAASK